MNTRPPFVALISIAAVSVSLLAGCSTSQPGLFNASNPTPPTSLERQLFDVVTNYAPRVVVQTNIIQTTNYATVVVTNVIDQVTQRPVWVTNFAQVTEYATNVVTSTNQVPIYQLAPGKGSEAATAIGGTVAAPFGWCGVVSLVLGALGTTYLSWRNKALAGSVATANAVSETLAQNIQTLRRVIETTPQGAQLGALVKQYLMQHQTENGVIQQVAEIVADVVDEPSAKLAAQEMQKLLQQVGAKS